MNPSPSPEPRASAVESQWLVHCSPERTLVARRHEGETVLVKIFEQGSQLEAEQEAATARLLGQPGVVAYRGAGQDPVTGKPCVTMEFCEGQNLERVVADAGPLGSSRATALMHDVARVLLDFHERPRPNAPHGFVHRDVKPSNLQLVRDARGGDAIVLIDLEHVIARRGSATDRDAPSSVGFTGGTHGYAPAESYFGMYPNAGFDVFALGATLYFLLTGTPVFPRLTAPATVELVRTGRWRTLRLRGQPAALQRLVTACLRTDERRRPTTADVLAMLAAHRAARTEAETWLDRALQGIQAGDFAAAEQILARADAAGDPERHAELVALLDRRRRLLARIGGVPVIVAPDPAAPVDLIVAAREVTASLPRIEAFLSRFPCHAGMLAARQAMARTGHRLLELVPPRIAALKMTARFVEARALITDAAGMAAQLDRIPGGIDLPIADSGHLPGPLLRNPGQLLGRFLRDIENTERIHQRLIEQLEAAEATLDLGAAGLVVEQITAIYGGASTVAAPLKDRLHRLDFYLQRIAAPRRLLGQLGETLELSEQTHDVDRVVAFSEFCQGRTSADVGSIRGKGGVRALLETLHQLVEDFPHAQVAVADAESALRDAMRSVTLQAWRGVTDAKEKLDAVPIPIRPVQQILNRLDGIRMLEAFLDLPERSRERLLDEIERVRVRLDQARTTRDNIARGAEEAMARGHLTTALFDMARAVDGFEDEPDGQEDEGEGTQLTERLEEAKRRKQELERAIVENHRLAAAYVELLEDETSTMAVRLGVLEDRARILQQLIGTLGPERGSHYVTDLREVLLHLLQEKADQGERQLDRAKDAPARLEIAQATLRGLRETLSNAAMPAETGGRIRRLLDHWLFKEREAHEQVSHDTRAAVESRRRRRHAIALRTGTAVVLMLATAGVWHVAYGKGPAAPQVDFRDDGLRVARAGGRVTFPEVRAYTALTVFVDRLRAARLQDWSALRDLDLLTRASQVVKPLGDLVGQDAAQPDDAWARGFTSALLGLEQSIGDLERRVGSDPDWRSFVAAVRSFGRSAHAAGLGIAVAHKSDAAYIERMCGELATVRHLALPAATTKEFAAMARRD